MHEIEGCITTTAFDKEQIGRLVAENNKRKLPNFCNSPWWREQVRVAVVGGGPSLKQELDKLSKYSYILCCGSVHDYLVSQDIKPTWCALVDSDPLMVNYIQKADKQVTYLVASQCSTELFDRLKDFNVYTWHADGDTVEDKDSFFGKGESLVGGGCTVGTRAIILAIGMGFTNIDLFGFDSCLTNTYEHHAYPFNDPNVETLGNITEIKLGGLDSPTFKVADYMLAQIFDFKSILKAFANRVRFTVYGTGAIAYLMELAYNKEVVKNGSAD